MKPPPRKRAKVERTVGVEPASRNLSKWQQPEKRKLLKALNTLHKASGANTDIDYAFLKKCIVTRSVSEIQCVVESLKDKVISGTIFELNKWKSERKLRKPIEIWTDMAFSVTGKLDEHISAAFSQILMVSSTEPLTLKNCDPPQLQMSSRDNFVGRTVPRRPVPCVSYVQARPMDSQAAQLNQQSPKTASQVTSAAPPASQSTAHPKAAEKSPPPPSGEDTAATQDGSGPTCQQTAIAPPVPLQPLSPRPDVASGRSPEASNSRLSQSAAEAHARFGRTSKYATKDSPRTLGVKCVVDFEKIYCYLSAVHKPDKECNLTPMESAIVLDLLMSLPEELPLLDCNKLHKHLTQVYKCFSSPANSSDAKETLRKLRSAFASSPGGEPTTGEQTATTAADAGGRELRRNESQPNRSAPKQSEATKEPDFSPPPLNPFMIPLDMLRRK